MNIPNFATEKLTDEKGNMTTVWGNILSQIIQQLQINLSNEGYVLPQLTTAEINDLTNAAKSTGAMVYDTTLNEFKVNINGTWKVVTVT